MFDLVTTLKMLYFLHCSFHSIIVSFSFLISVHLVFILVLAF